MRVVTGLRALVGVGAITALSGCSALITGAVATAGSNEDNLRTRTAAYFSVSESRVRISNISRGPVSTGYRARVNGVTYNCGYTFGSVACERPGG